ncbi:MAG: hypothetical protein V4439_02610 [Patescibacteria group bacterium]
MGELKMENRDKSLEEEKLEVVINTAISKLDDGLKDLKSEIETSSFPDEEKLHYTTELETYHRKIRALILSTKFTENPDKEASIEKLLNDFSAVMEENKKVLAKE